MGDSHREETNPQKELLLEVMSSLSQKLRKQRQDKGTISTYVLL